MGKNFFILWMLFASCLFSGERKIALLVKKDFNGELAFAHRVRAACKNLAWTADLIYIEQPDELQKTKYDMVINLVPGTYSHPNCGNYLAVFNPAHHFFSKNRFLKPKYQSYDGYLLTYPNLPFKKRKSFLDRRRFPFMSWYPTGPKKEYRVNEPNSLFYICCWWGNRFQDEKFKQLLKALDQEPYMRFYGHTMFQSYYPKSYRGPIPYEEDSLYNTIAEAGVVLILHSAEHNKYGVPSGRIFEAAASSSVIICDLNAFVKKHFGDSVLYIDTAQDASSILEQIRSHMNWIGSHKMEALEKAKMSHAIYNEKFSLEDQLLRLEKFHEKLSYWKKKPIRAWFQNLWNYFFSRSSSIRGDPFKSNLSC